MGLFKKAKGIVKKVTKPIAKVLDKVVPNEIKPYLPYLAAIAPVLGPAGAFGKGIASLGKYKAAGLYGLGALGAQLSQEGSEGDFDILPIAMAAGSGYLAAPGTTGTTTAQGLADQGISRATDPKLFQTEMANRSFLTQAKDLGITGIQGVEDILQAPKTAEGFFGKTKAITTAASPAVTGQLGQDAYNFAKQAEADYLAELDAFNALADEQREASDEDRRSHITASMLRANFPQSVIDRTLEEFGLLLKDGGRVGLQEGGMSYDYPVYDPNELMSFTGSSYENEYTPEELRLLRTIPVSDYNTPGGGPITQKVRNQISTMRGEPLMYPTSTQDSNSVPVGTRIISDGRNRYEVRPNGSLSFINTVTPDDKDYIDNFNKESVEGYKFIGNQQYSDPSVGLNLSGNFLEFTGYGDERKGDGNFKYLQNITPTTAAPTTAAPTPTGIQTIPTDKKVFNVMMDEKGNVMKDQSLLELFRETGTAPEIGIGGPVPIRSISDVFRLAGITGEDSVAMGTDYQPGRASVLDFQDALQRVGGGTDAQQQAQTQDFARNEANRLLTKAFKSANISGINQKNRSGIINAMANQMLPANVPGLMQVMPPSKTAGMSGGFQGGVTLDGRTFQNERDAIAGLGIERYNQLMADGGIASFKDGGIMDLGGKEMDMRTGGFIPIGAKERADDVPARLSKNEFVMTADAVKAAGGGSVNKGAKRMYNLMHNLEARA